MLFLCIILGSIVYEVIRIILSREFIKKCMENISYHKNLLRIDDQFNLHGTNEMLTDEL